MVVILQDDDGQNGTHHDLRTRRLLEVARLIPEISMKSMILLAGTCLALAACANGGLNLPNMPLVGQLAQAIPAGSFAPVELTAPTANPTLPPVPVTINLTPQPAPSVNGYGGISPTAVCRPTVQVQNNSPNAAAFILQAIVFDRYSNPAGQTALRVTEMAPGENRLLRFDTDLGMSGCADLSKIKIVVGDPQSWPNSCAINRRDARPCPVVLTFRSSVVRVEGP